MSWREMNHDDVGDTPLGGKGFKQSLQCFHSSRRGPDPYNWKWYRRAAGSAIPRQLSIRQTALSELGFVRLNDIRFEFFIISLCHRSRAER